MDLVLVVPMIIIVVVVGGGFGLYFYLVPRPGPASLRRVRARVRRRLTTVVLILVAPVFVLMVARIVEGNSLILPLVLSLPGLLGLFIFTMLLRRLNRIELRRAFRSASRSVGR